MKTDNSELIRVSLPFAISISSYHLQSISDLYYIDNIAVSTKIAHITAMRHYRASIILTNQQLRDIVLPTTIYNLSNKDNINIDDLTSITIDNDNKIKEVLSINYNINKISSDIFKNEIDKNDKIGKVRAIARAMDRNRELKQTYYNMINITNIYFRYLLNIPLELAPEEKKIFDNSSICLQCGEVYYDSNKINDECCFCKAGINHVLNIWEIL